ncbi:HNH endonuclease [Rossellomorea aquimaris]|nr:HNH endonuclease [Rossellomorea aquimaris]WRP06309.1 HNH endonuclease [Rossellomorea aquimaris]
MNGVNLDAFIKRDDFRLETDEEDFDDYGVTTEKVLFELEKRSMFFSLLRKPDFQRETVYWEPQKVCNLIENYLDGDLIPAIILWRSPANLVFVLDGAHRLSVLIAWVNDDYGDGDISKTYYGDYISEKQLKLAQKTRELVHNRIGTYKEHQSTESRDGNTQKSARARRMALRKIDIQWVRGNAEKAEEAFFRINQNAAKISKTEIELLKQRKSPLTIAARAILRNGTGHKYWSNFEKSIQLKIEKVATEVHKLLFEPSLNGNIINTLDLPIGGNTPSNKSLTMIFDLIRIINDKYTLKTEVELERDLPQNEQLNLFGDEIKKEVKQISADDEDGSFTIEVLNKCKSILSRISSKQSNSLGLSSIVYVYSHRTGNFQVTSLMALVEFVKYLDEYQLFNEFTKVRDEMEKIIIEHNSFIEQIISKYGSGSKGYKHIKNLFVKILAELNQGKNRQEVLEVILNTFNYLRISTTFSGENEPIRFSSSTKSALFIKESLNQMIRCKICKGHITSNSITYDHIVRRRDGGVGSFNNGQLAHPYCNSVFKH